MDQRIGLFGNTQNCRNIFSLLYRQTICPQHRPQEEETKVFVIAAIVANLFWRHRYPHDPSSRHSALFIRTNCLTTVPRITASQMHSAHHGPATGAPVHFACIGDKCCQMYSIDTPKRISILVRSGSRKMRSTVIANSPRTYIEFPRDLKQVRKVDDVNFAKYHFQNLQRHLLKHIPT